MILVSKSIVLRCWVRIPCLITRARVTLRTSLTPKHDTGLQDGPTVKALSDIFVSWGEKKKKLCRS